MSHGSINTTDITYLRFGHSMLYLSSIMDIYNGKIVAYKIDDKQDQSLVNDTLNQIHTPEYCILQVPKAVFINLMLIINYAKKKVLSKVYPEREHLPIMPR